MTDIKKDYRDWKIRLKNLDKMNYPLRFFEIDFANDEIAAANYDIYVTKKILGQLSAKELKKHRVSKEQIKIGEVVIACIPMTKNNKSSWRVRKLLIKENYEGNDEEVEKKILCWDIKGGKEYDVPMESMYILQKPEHYHQVELDGLQKFENMPNFKKFILIEEELKEPLFVKIVAWKKTHLCVALRKFKWSASINTKLILMMKSVEQNHFSSKASNHSSLDTESSESIPPTIQRQFSFNINTALECWFKWTAKMEEKGILTFLVSKVFGDPAKLLIHPLKYWKQFQNLEKDLKEKYGPLLQTNKDTPHQKYNPLMSGPFVVVVEDQDETDENGEKIRKFYRGRQTGEYSFGSDTHSIEFIDYATTKSVENKNLVPMLEEHSLLGVMGCICSPILGDKHVSELIFFKNNECVGQLASWECDDNGRVVKLAINKIRVISAMERYFGFY